MPEGIEQISTVPDPFEAYRISQAIRVGELVYTSGQAAIDLEGNLVGVGDFDAQAAQVFSNLQAVLEAADAWPPVALASAPRSALLTRIMV